MARRADRASGRGADHGGDRLRGSRLIIYLDTSALVKMLVAEFGSATVAEAVARSDRQASSHVTYVEARSALQRARAGGRIDRRTQRRAIDRFEQNWRDFVVIPVDEPTIDSAARLAEAHTLRGFDAVQLASALRAHNAEPVTFACFDADLREAARREGLEVLET